MASDKIKTGKQKIADRLSLYITAAVLLIFAVVFVVFALVDFRAMELGTITYVLIFLAGLVVIGAITLALTRLLIGRFACDPESCLLSSDSQKKDGDDASADKTEDKGDPSTKNIETKQNDETGGFHKNDVEMDLISGLLTRPSFIKKAGEVIRNAKSGSYAVICVDIDNFGAINERFGYSVGDTVLHIMGVAIRLDQEENDWYACRDSADRFFMIRPVEKTVKGKICNVEDIIDRSTPVEIIHFHAGACVADDANGSIRYYMDCARAAMDKSQTKYGKELNWFDAATQKQFEKEKALAATCDAGIAEKKFLPCFQPKYDYEGGKMIGAEALVRWDHPEYGMLSPGEFIPLFEKNGFITKLGEYMLDSVCGQLSVWKKAGYETVPVSVNLSRSEIAEEGLCKKLHGIVMKHGLNTDDIRFEVTAQSFNDSPEKLKALIAGLHDYGYKVELDNYGIGHLAAKTLMNLPVDTLKFDGSVIKSLENKEKTEAAMAMLIQVAHLMGVPGIAQGVESDEVAQELKAMGCRMMQGYLFAKPLFAEEFERLLTKAQTK